MIRALIGAVALLALALGWSLWRAEVHKGETAQAVVERNTARGERDGYRAESEQFQRVLATERAQARVMAGIAQQFEEDQRETERQAAADLAELRSGTLRLRQQWQGCEADRHLPGTGAAAAEPDAAAGLREQGATDLVRIGAECDARIRRLQDVIGTGRPTEIGKPPQR